MVGHRIKPQVRVHRINKEPAPNIPTLMAK